MSCTPTKTDSSTFIPREINTPNKDHPGISKTVFSHISNLRTFVNDWNRIRDKGFRLCRAISALKLHECTDDYYPQQLEPLMESLLEALESLGNINDGIKVISTQLEALAKLQPTDQPVISTWSTTLISASVKDMCQSLQKEFRLKQVVIENIAHCRDEKLIEVYVSAWELDPYFKVESFVYLFAEVGLAGVT